MHFLREALYRKPLESNQLVYGRTITAITFSGLFLAFCGFLISQIYFDQYLIEVSSEDIVDYIDTPDIEICAQNSTMKITKCNAMYYNWTSVDVPNCWERFFRRGVQEPGSTTICYVFETNNTYRMATGLIYDNRDALRRLDFYWNIDSLTNLSYSTVSIPAVAIQLYDPHFSFWKKYTLGTSKVEEQTITNIRLGATRATTMLNYTSNIFYFPQKYRAIRPFSPAAIIGFKPDYIDIMTLKNYQHNWPLLTNPPLTMYNRSLYQGLFSVQLGQSTIDVKTEVRQYTLLANLALAGGCYGLLTTIYILLFGMTRLTPWGLVHHIPAAFIKTKKQDIEEEKPAAVRQNSILLPWVNESSKRRSASSDFFSRFKETSQIEPKEIIETTDIQGLYQLLSFEREKSERLENRSQELSDRVQELEIILTEYFIDTAYLDNLRHKQNILSISANNEDQKTKS